ncbi:MAG TPA: hypothetical protein VHF22_12270, partial [Planctomycetota bacterium]|nr:hypothetical protein [Planctomycetota bacterium]
MGLNGIGDLGGRFHMPDWIHELTGSGGASHVPDFLHAGETSVAAPPPPPAATPAALTTCAEVWSAIGKAVDKLHGGDSAGQIGWLKALGQGAKRDVTDRFKQLDAAAAAGQDTLPADAKSYVYLNVGGLFTEHYPGYFDD